jgi:SAM-dependent methyltransferase
MSTQDGPPAVSPAGWEFWRDQNKQGWDSRVPVHIGPNGYQRSLFLENPDHISDVIRFDRDRMGDVGGLNVCHLQCHIGTDTLSLLRLGARSVTGLDLSPASLTEARWLFEQVGASARFVESDVFDAAANLNATYDMIYASVGAINWINDIAKWMRIAASLLEPGGSLYLRDCHPFFFSIDPDSSVDLRIKYDYFETAEPQTTQNVQTYVGDGTPIAFPICHEWSHGLAEIIMGAVHAGFSIDALYEDDFADWQAFPNMIAAENGRYRMPEGAPRFPFYFTLMATKR